MKARGWRRRWIAACATLLLLVAAALPAGAETQRTWRLSYEVLSAQHAQPKREATYAEKEALTRAALAEIVPHVWSHLDAVAARARSRVRAGGYEDDVNPAIHSNLVTGEHEARRLAAALGYVFRQWAVIMYDLDAEASTARYVSVRYPRGTLTLAKSVDFFARARAHLASNKLGFSAFGNRLVFINLNTGIADDVFAAGLTKAAADFPDAGIKIEPPKPVRAFLIENDWEKAKEGEEYLRQINPASAEVTAALKRLQSRHEGRVRRWAQFLQ